MFQYAYLVLSLLLLAVWFILYFAKSTFRKEMLWVSFWTMFLALTEPFFVPDYWNPITLFDLARRTGFDLESFIFCFAVGGIVAVLFEAIFKSNHLKMSAQEKSLERHRLHFLIVLSGPLTFLILFFSTELNPIYSAIIALIIAFFATSLCRPDLVKKMLVSGLMFSAIYFIFFLLLKIMFPIHVGDIWNLSALSGIFLLGVPIEELMWAFTFGLYWSSIYEHFAWYKLKNNL